jgi:hypothetical protein
MGRDLVRATLVHYVHEATGQFHDDQVAALISVAESLISIDARFAEPEVEPPTEYTTEAHSQWRNRDSCENFLNGPSPAVRELLADMDSDLTA